MWNARPDESQAAIKTARRNINNLRYADNTTLVAKSEEELKNLMMRVKVVENAFMLRHHKLKREAFRIYKTSAEFIGAFQYSSLPTM